MAFTNDIEVYKPVKAVVPAPSHDSLYTDTSSIGGQPPYEYFGITTSKQVDGADHSSFNTESCKENVRSAKPDTSQFPDGGPEAWLVTFGAWLVFFVCWGPINMIGIMQEYYQQQLLIDYSPSAIAWISSAKLFMMYAGGAIFGKLFDSYGPRWLLLIGSAMHVYGFMMTPFSTKYYQIFLSQAICSAAGASCIYYACAGSTTTWFLRKRSTAFGIAASGSAFGGVILPIMVLRLIPKVGFPWAMRIVGFLILGMVIIINITVKSRLKHTPKPFRINEYVKPFQEPSFSLLTLSMTVFVFGLFVLYNFLVLQAQSEEMSPRLAEYLVPILNAASIPGRIVPGVLADKMGNFNVMFVTMLCSGLVTLTLWLPSSSNAAIIAFTIIYGVFSGAYIALAPILIAQISKIQQIGVRSGALFLGVSIAALTGGPLAGALLDTDHGGFEYIQIFAGSMMCAAAGLLLISRAFTLGFTIAKA